MIAEPFIALARRAACLAAAVAAVVCVPLLAAEAQSTDESRDAQQRVEDIRAQQNIGIAAVGAILGRDCPPVSFAEVLANPDSVELNTCYAVQQIQDGNVRGAAATLERVLLVRPEQADVRLLYAIVLYRLDSLAEAEREFLAVRELAQSPQDRERIDRYLERITKRQQTTRHTVTLSLGGHYDTNRNAAPRGEELLVVGARTPIANANNREVDDTAVMGVARYDVVHDLGLQREHEAFASVTAFQDDQTERDELDLQSGSVEAGFRLDTPIYTVTPKLTYTNMTLSRQKFFTSIEASIRAERRFRLSEGRPPVDFWVELARRSENFHNISENQSLTDRNGMATEGEIGATMRVLPRHQISASLSQTYKEAEQRYQGYRFWNGRVQHLWLIGDGRFLNSSFSWGARMYRAFDPLVTSAAAPKRRREEPKRLRVTYGMPAGDLMDQLGYEVKGEVTGAVREFMDDVTLAATGEYLFQHSNIPNFEYKNRRAQVLLTKRYEF